MELLLTNILTNHRVLRRVVDNKFCYDFFKVSYINNLPISKYVLYSYTSDFKKLKELLVELEEALKLPILDYETLKEI